MTPRRGTADQPLILGMLVLLFLAQALGAARIKTATFDEPAHIGAGLSYLRTGEIRVNPQHPPLLKEIAAALPALLGAVRWPLTDEEWRRIAPNLPPHFQWQLGNDVLFSGDPGRALFLARLPLALLAGLLGWTIALWGRRMLGGAAAFGALLLFALDPTMVAHAALVTTDVGFAAFTVLFVYALWHYLNHRSLKRLLLCGLALGGALASKFSAVFLLPIATLLLLWALRFIPSAVPRRVSTLADPYASAENGQRAVWCVYALAAMAAIAAVVVHAAYLVPRNPFLYLEGLRQVNADHDAQYVTYMAGGFGRRFFSYYALAWLLKEPLATIALVVAGIVALLRRGGASVMDRVFLMAPPAILFAAYSLFSHNLGFRYVIPALPFLHLIGGFGLAALWRGGTGRRLLAVALCLWLAIAAAGIYPDHLSYFNEAACALERPSWIGIDGGSRCGPWWFDDSNVDWGQGLLQLREWLARNPHGGLIRLAYFGTSRPESYGIAHERIGVDDLLRRPAPGRYVISAHMLARTMGVLAARFGEGEENWLLRARPVAIVGHAYYVYDVDA